MSTATIDLKIKAAYKETEALYKKEPTWQEKVDKLLDRMNKLNRMLTTLHSLLMKLTFEMERDMEGFKQSKTATKNIEKIVALSVKMLNKVHQSNLFPGVKTTYYTLKQEVSYLNELIHDRKVSLELDDDDEMQSIVEATLSAARLK